MSVRLYFYCSEHLILSIFLLESGISMKIKIIYPGSASAKLHGDDRSIHTYVDNTFLPSNDIQILILPFCVSSLIHSKNRVVEFFDNIMNHSILTINELILKHYLYF